VSPRVGLYTFAGLFLGIILASIVVFLSAPRLPVHGAHGDRSA